MLLLLLSLPLLVLLLLVLLLSLPLLSEVVSPCCPVQALAGQLSRMQR